MRARWYRQVTGRFVSRDPVEGKKCCGLSWNPYIYVKQNPVNAVDPIGKDEFADYLGWEYAESAETIEQLRRTGWVLRVELCVEAKLSEWVFFELYWDLSIEY